MQTGELFRSCSNEYVAAAALRCIGGGLLRRIDSAAQLAGLTRGALVARLVIEYDRKASPSLRKQLALNMRYNEIPILAGLRHVLEAALAGSWDFSSHRAHDPQWRGAGFHWAVEPKPVAGNQGWRALH